MHNLKRVKAGLKGEHLGADLIFEKFGGEGLPDLIVENEVAEASDLPIGGLERQEHEMEGGWQDKEVFERQQDVVQGEIGKSDNALDGNLKVESGQVPRVRATKSTGEIDARREAKKDRRRKGRSTREEKRKREKDANG